VTTAIRLARALGLAAACALLLPAAALAAPPTHAPAVSFPVDLPAGDYCEHAVVLTNPSFRSKDTQYAPLPDGTIRIRDRGMASSLATDVTTGATSSSSIHVSCSMTTRR